MTPNQHSAPRLPAWLLVLGTVLLQLLAAWILDLVAKSVHQKVLWVAAVTIALAIAINLGRFLIWRHAHRHFPLSQTYPLTALFFPCVLLLSWWHGQHITSLQMLGTALITFGVMLMAAPRKTGADHDR